MDARAVVDAFFDRMTLAPRPMASRWRATTTGMGRSDTLPVSTVDGR